MSTFTPPEPDLRALLRKLSADLAIHEAAKEHTDNAQIRRTNDILIAEAKVAISWVKYLLDEHVEIEYRRFLP